MGHSGRVSSTNHITRQPVPPTDSVRVKAAVAAHEAADAATDRRVDTTFDKFHDRYSTRSLGLKTSPVRALFAVANRPEVVSLAGGMPNIADLPLDVVSESLKELVDTRGTVVMQYGSGQGEPEMRKHICWYLRGFYGAAHFREAVMLLTRWDDVTALLHRMEDDTALIDAFSQPGIDTLSDNEYAARV